MKNHVTIITLGVRDMARSYDFYSKLFDKGLNGGQTCGAPYSGHPQVAVFFWNG